ncbi:MAG: hypothetical protein M0Z70_04840 [Nitrospiraceae bacterium]|jgi:hypothetical protein|nr:hypothetical protein [Nitrospiraceae bacterium]
MNNENDLISRLRHYYALSMAVMKDFGGPSIYFHIQAIKEQAINFLSDRHVEMIYATLASWGMHRMGDPEETKAKMVDFTIFKQSLLDQRDKLKNFADLKMDTCTVKEYENYIQELKEIYYGLKVSISDATIVAHSKALAHILPELIPPIDRQYTIRFFTQDNKNFFSDSGNYRTVNVPKDMDAQFKAFCKYTGKIKALLDRCDCQMFQIDKNSFNTSNPKIMDNLIMAFVKDVPKPKKKNAQQ